ncbi:hypothetical protein LBMAG21_13980 [Armatimonadota bacterium]|nr:hypothetical protein LBMAG21_13980 [Armatimonadota bacterium]
MKPLRNLILSVMPLALLPLISPVHKAPHKTARLQPLPDLRGEVVDTDTGKPLACRIYLQGTDGTWYFPHSLGGESAEYKRQPTPKSVEMHSCLSAHPFQVTLPAGRYTLTAEHGKEYLTTTFTFDHSEASKPLRVSLKRWIDMPAKGWYSADTHAHRSPQEMPLLQAAEDVNVAFPLTFWVTKAFLPPAQGDKNQAVEVSAKPVYIDSTHVYWPINTEYELFTVDGKPHTLGAVFALNHKAPLRNGAPPVGAVGEEVHKQGGLLELDKHCWEWTMNIVPLMKVDLYDLANNHLWRTEWGVPSWGIPSADYMHIERTAEGWTEAGWVDYGFQNYYALLNCGFNLRPTGGTGTGYHPVPLGWGRVYAHLSGKFSYEAWVKALDAGHSFVTNGPLLTVTVDGKEMGTHFQQKVAAQKAYHVVGEASSTAPLHRIEIVVNGKVARTLHPENHKTPQGGYTSRIDSKIPITGSSWLLVRCFEARTDKRVRFAHTAPAHITVPGLPLRPRKEEVAYLIQRVKDEIARSEGVLPPSVLTEYRLALQTYESIAQSAQ